MYVVMFKPSETMSLSNRVFKSAEEAWQAALPYDIASAGKRGNYYVARIVPMKLVTVEVWEDAK